MIGSDLSSKRIGGSIPLYAWPTPRDSIDQKRTHIRMAGSFLIVESRERSLKCKDDSPGKIGIKMISSIICLQNWIWRMI